MATALDAPATQDIPTSISFDSLKCLPTSMPWVRRSQQQQQQQQRSRPLVGPESSAAPDAAAAEEPAQAGGAHATSAGAPPPPPPAQPGRSGWMRQSTFEAVASALRETLGLTLFGFDLVYDAAAGGRPVPAPCLPACLPPDGRLQCVLVVQAVGDHTRMPPVL
jgi:hypothetical protein